MVWLSVGTSKDMFAWLQDLLVGDRVIVNGGGGWGAANKLTRVARLTKTQIIVTDGSRFKRRNGRAVGDAGRGYHAMLLEEATEERVRRIKECAQVLRDKMAIREFAEKVARTDTDALADRPVLREALSKVAKLINALTERGVWS